MLIKYVGHRPEYKDALYGTGYWFDGQVKGVPEDVAGKMLRHLDVYAPVGLFSAPTGEQPQSDGRQLFSMAAWPGVSVEIVQKQIAATQEEVDPDQDARDAVAAMDSKEAVADYARINFNQMIPRTLSLDNMKQRAITMIDQYGAQ